MCGCAEESWVCERHLHSSEKKNEALEKLLDTAKSLDDSFAKREASAQCNGISSSIAALEQLQICRLQNSPSNSLSAVPTPQQHFELPVVPVSQDKKIVKPNELKDDEAAVKTSSLDKGAADMEVDENKDKKNKTLDEEFEAEAFQLLQSRKHAPVMKRPCSKQSSQVFKRPGAKEVQKKKYRRGNQLLKQQWVHPRK